MINYCGTDLNQTRGSEGKWHTLHFVWLMCEWATLHSNGCQAQGKLHSHVSWQQVVPLWEKQQRWGSATGRVVPQSWHKVALCLPPPGGLKEDSSMIWVIAHLFYIFYLFEANVTKKTCSTPSPPSQAKNNYTMIAIKNFYTSRIPKCIELNANISVLTSTHNMLLLTRFNVCHVPHLSLAC